jgi:prepilin-type N-terminal cleavage/methylation domain-containing protein
MRSILKEKQGFTLIEIIMVLVIISIVGITVLVRRPDVSAQAIGGRAVIKNHIRYAQLMAMTSNTVCGIQFKGSVYSLFRNGSLADMITLPNHTGTDFPIPEALGTTTGVLYFDLWGIPYSFAGLTTPRSTGLIGSLGITISTDTGYVK